MNIQEFNLIKTRVENLKSRFELESNGVAFPCYILESMFELSKYEIFDCMTDTSFLRSIKNDASHDRGIDAIYIEDDDDSMNIHLFNCKYKEKFDSARESNFPSNEIEKITNVLNKIMDLDRDFLKGCNVSLSDKLTDVMGMLEEGKNLNIIVYLCSNTAKGLTEDERKRFERDIIKYTSCSVKYILFDDLIDKATKSKKIIINGKIKVSKSDILHKSGGNINAIIAVVNAIDLLRLISDDEDMRFNTGTLDEDVFDQNVRLYLKQKGKINRNIFETARSDDRLNFFYFNNGITILCKKSSFNPADPFPIISLNDVQVVNGSQTLHALFDVMKDNFDKLSDVNLLCRLYETDNDNLVARIAEYTNSQNPVKVRDIRSIDYIQICLEADLKTHGYYYERKKNQHQDQEVAKRIDSEKIGQILLAFYKHKPSIARNKKAAVFGETYYDEIFNEKLNATDVILANSVFNYIEEEKSKIRESGGYLLYASFHLAYLMSKLSELNKSSLVSQKQMPNCYQKSVEVLANIVKGKGEIKSYTDFFKTPFIEQFDLSKLDYRYIEE